MPTELSDPTLERVRRLFPGKDREEAIRLLVEDCAEGLPFRENTSPQSLERIRFAALKVSEGDLRKLRDAVRLAQIDWRDLLVAAGFELDVDAHRYWWPEER